MAANNKPWVLVKIGGKPAAHESILDQLLSDLAMCFKQGLRAVLVHGGGADVSELSRKLGMEPVFANGRRLTSPTEMSVVDAVLAGQVNTRILRRSLSLGIPAVGLSGVDCALFTGVSLDPEHDSRTGTITNLNTSVLSLLADQSILPVISSVSATTDGMGLNINADDAAMELAKKLGAHSLVFLSDIPGILKAGQVIPRIDQALAMAEIESGTISGGMIPKVQGALDALSAGIGNVLIGDYEASGDLQAFLAGSRGTCICHPGKIQDKE